MSFWATSSGQIATGDVQESGGFDPLPKGDYDGFLDKAEIQTWEGKKSINLRTRIGKRVIFLTLKCWDEDAKKRDRNLNLLVKFFQIAKVQMPAGEPDDMDLAKLCDKPMRFKLDVWETDDKQKSGNWLVNVDAVGAKAGESKPATAKAAPPKAAPSHPDEEDQIPF